MRYILGSLLAFTTSVARAQSLDSLDAQTGFRDLVFGKQYDPVHMPGFYEDNFDSILNSARGNMRSYHRHNDDLHIDGILAERIQYYFCDDIFVGTAAQFKGLENRDRVMHAAMARYGLPNAVLAGQDTISTTALPMNWKGHERDGGSHVLQHSKLYGGPENYED